LPEHDTHQVPIPINGPVEVDQASFHFDERLIHVPAVLVREMRESVKQGAMNLPDKNPSSLFQRCHFNSSIIILCVRWYLTYKLSYRDLVAMMAERNVDVAHTTIYTVGAALCPRG